jgi:hypothetical protein
MNQGAWGRQRRVDKVGMYIPGITQVAGVGEIEEAEVGGVVSSRNGP